MSILYRTLSLNEINQLESQGCYSKDWKKVKIHSETDLTQVHFSGFSGKVSFGPFHKKDTGIRHSTIEDSHIGANSKVAYVGEMKHVLLGESCLLQNIGSIHELKEEPFANQVSIYPLNGTSKREFPLSSTWRADLAEAFLFYFDPKTRKDFLKTLKVERKRPKLNEISDRCKLENIGYVANVHLAKDTEIVNTNKVIGLTSIKRGNGKSRIDGAQLIQSSMIVDGTIIGDGCIVRRSWVDTGVRITDQAFVEESLIWSNSEIALSEVSACVFGPFAVTHHRSSLQIAGKYSFYNSGSGTNFSNHQYRLGAIHQGVLERGVKMGSDAYLLWPAKIAAFSTVIGRHKNHPDTSFFPFGLLLEEGGQSLLMPGYNIFNIGSLRDELKWKGRDRRTGFSYPMETSRFNLTCLIQLFKGHEILKEHNKGDFLGKGFKVKRIFIEKYLEDIELVSSFIYFFLSQVCKPGQWNDGAYLDLAGNIIPQDQLSENADLSKWLYSLNKSAKHEKRILALILRHFPKMKNKSITQLEKDKSMVIQKYIADGKKEFSETILRGQLSLTGEKKHDIVYTKQPLIRDLKKGAIFDQLFLNK